MGLGHNTDCDSVMTYCSTFGNTYLAWGNVYDQTVAAQKYDAHYHS